MFVYVWNESSRSKITFINKIPLMIVKYVFCWCCCCLRCRCIMLLFCFYTSNEWRNVLPLWLYPRIEPFQISDTICINWFIEHRDAIVRLMHCDAWHIYLCKWCRFFFVFANPIESYRFQVLLPSHFPLPCKSYLLDSSGWIARHFTYIFQHDFVWYKIGIWRFYRFLLGVCVRVLHTHTCTVHRRWVVVAFLFTYLLFQQSVVRRSPMCLLPNEPGHYRNRP